MKERIFNNWKSSAVGFFLLLVAGIVVLSGGCTLTEFAAFVPFCLGMIYVKDSIWRRNG